MDHGEAGDGGDGRRRRRLRRLRLRRARAARPAPQPRRRRAHHRLAGWGMRRLGGFLVAAFAVSILSLGLLQHRLGRGPVPLDPLAGLIEARVNLPGAAVRLSVGGAALTLDEVEGRPRLILRDLRLTGADGTALGGAPEVSANFRLPDLLRGRVAPTRLALVGAEVTVWRRPDGALALQPQGEGPWQGAGAFLALLDAAGQGGEGPLARLTELAARSLTVTFHDLAAGRSWRVDGAEAVLRREPEGERLLLTGFARPLEAEGSQAPPGAGPPARPARIALSGRRAADGALSAELRLDGAAMADLAAAAPELAPLGVVAAPVAGALDAEADAEGRVRRLTARLSLGPGRLGGAEGPPFERFEADLDWRAEDGQLRLTRLEIEAAAGRLLASGRARPLGAGIPAETYALRLDLHRLELTEAAGMAGPLAFAGGTLNGALRPGLRRLEVAAMRLPAAAAPGAPGAGAVLEAQGFARIGPDGPAAAGVLRAATVDGALDLSDVLALWPAGVAPRARAFVVDRVDAARIAGFEARGWIGPGAEPELHLDFGLAGLDLRVLPGFPAVRGASGRGRISLRRLEMAFDGGQVTPPGGGAVALAGSVFAIPDVRARPPTGRIDLRAEGAVADMLALIDAPPLRVFARRDAPIPAVEGRATAEAALELPLVRGVAIGEVALGVSAELRDLAAEVPGAGRTLRAPAARLSADLTGLSLRGSGRLDDLPLDFAWDEGWGEAPSREVEASAALDQALLAALGLGGAARLSGPPGRLTVALSGLGPAMALSAAADLGPPALAAPGLGWTKPAGAPARLRAEGRLAPGGGLDLSALSLRAPGLAAAGSLRLAPGGGLAALELSRLELAAPDGATALDVSAALAPAPEVQDLEPDEARLTAPAGGVSVRVGGARIDLGALARLDARAGAEGRGPGGAGFLAEIAVDRLVLAEGIALHDARGLLRRADGVTLARLRGQVNGQAPGRLRWREGRSGASALTLRSSDAGGLLAALGVTARGRGGALELRAEVPAEAGAAITGLAEITGLRVAAAPALDALAAEAAREGLSTPAGIGGGYDFDRIAAPFSYRAGRLEVRDALAVGSALGLKVSGVYDLGAQRLDLNGVATPAYAVNSLLNRVPLLGALLGGEGEGLIGLTFTVTGPPGAPVISANPFSVLAPGVLRRLLQPADPQDAAPPGGEDWEQRP